VKKAGYPVSGTSQNEINDNDMMMMMMMMMILQINELIKVYPHLGDSVDVPRQYGTEVD